MTVYKLRITKTYYTVRRGSKKYQYIKLIVNLPVDEKLLNVDYVYVLTPDEFEKIAHCIETVQVTPPLSSPQTTALSSSEATTTAQCEKLLKTAESLFSGKKYVKYEIFLETLKRAGIEVSEDVVKRCFDVVNKGKDKGLYVKLR